MTSIEVEPLDQISIVGRPSPKWEEQDDPLLLLPDLSRNQATAIRPQYSWTPTVERQVNPLEIGRKHSVRSCYVDQETHKPFRRFEMK